MKRKIILFIILCYSEFCFSQFYFDKTKFDVYYYAIDDYINIRQEPNTKSNILGKLFKDDEIIINQEKSSANWLFCYIPKYDCIGYCYSTYFKYKPFFYELLDNILADDYYTLSMIDSGNIKTVCLDLLIKEYLGNYSEEQCYKIIRHAYLSGCNYSSVDDTVMIEAVKKNYLSIVEYLIEIPVFKNELNIKKNQFAPPLFWSLWNGNEVITELLLKNGADPNYETVYGSKAIDNILEFIELNRIDKSKAESLERLLIQYGYKK